MFQFHKLTLNGPDNLPFLSGGKLPSEVVNMEELDIDISDCQHEPNRLDLIDSQYRGDEAIFIFRCNCGKSVTEFFRYTDTRVSD